MQRDRGLAGARTALDDEDTAEVRPDDLVLLGLDGLDDVAHAAGPARGQRGEQGALAAQGGQLLGGQRVEVEDVVLDVEEAPAAGAQVPAAYDAAGVGRGRPVERLGDRGPPVDEKRVVPLVGEPEPADVVPLAGRHVQPAEREPGLHGVELGQPVLVQGGEGVPLAAVLGSARGAAPSYLRQAGPGLVPERVEPVVEPGEMGLLPLELRLPARAVLLRHIVLSPPRASAQRRKPAVQPTRAGALSGRGGGPDARRRGPGRPPAARVARRRRRR